MVVPLVGLYAPKQCVGVVGVRGNEALEKRFPFVDVFMEPSTDGQPLVAHLTNGEDYQIDQENVIQLCLVKSIFSRFECCTK